jgi:alpha-glucuronidase
MRLQLTTLLCVLSFASAEDGSQGWLRYAPIPDGPCAQSVPAKIIALNSTKVSPVYTAGQELQRGVGGIIGRKLNVSSSADQSQSAIIVGTWDAYVAAYGSIDECENLDEDGFFLSTATPGKVIIVGENERGALYGAFEYLSQLAQDNVTAVSAVYNPQVPIRWTNEWDNMDGSIERGYAGLVILIYEQHVRHILTSYIRIQPFAIFPGRFRRGQHDAGR